MIKLEIQAETIPELVKQVKELAKNFNLENVSRTTIVKPKIEVREKTTEEVKTLTTMEEPKKETPAEKFVKELKAEAPSIDACRLAYIEATHRGADKEKVKEILTELKVARITELPEEKRETFIDKVKALVKE